MASLQFLIDDMCAKFTVNIMYDVVRARVARGPSTLEEIALAVTEADRSLDLKSAQRLAEAAVDALTRSGDLVNEGGCVRAADATAGNAVHEGEEQ